MKLISFTTTLVLLISCLFILNSIQLTTSPFKTGNTGQLALIDQLPAADVINIKIHHAEISPRIKFGLFGDSRSIQVSSRDIDLNNGEFFNFATPGTSFRQTALYLEQLSRIGKVPETVLVSIDNFELQYFPNPTYPSAPRRWLYVLEDILFGMMNGSFVDTLKIIKRASIIEWDSLTRFFNFELMLRRLDYSFSWNNSAKSVAHYLPDGSRELQKEFQKVITESNSFADVKPNILPDFLERDMARLAKFDARVIIYESPIYPMLAIKLNRHPSPYAAATRKRFLEVCNAYKMECYIAPVLQEGKNLWGDNSHAPGSVLGAYLATVLKREPVR